MNSNRTAHTAYGAARESIATPRDVEAALIAQITSDLQRAKTSDMSAATRCEILHRNLKMWRAFEMDLELQSNGLNQELRQNLLELASFVFVHTDQVLRGEQTVDALIDLNRTIMSGLRQDLREVA